MNTYKYYGNRKLYRIKGSESGPGYVTLTDISADILAGRSIKIVHYETKNDLTNEFLGRCVSKMNLSPETLMQIIRGNYAN